MSTTRPPKVVLKSVGKLLSVVQQLFRSLRYLAQVHGEDLFEGLGIPYYWWNSKDVFCANMPCVHLYMTSLYSDFLMYSFHTNILLYEHDRIRFQAEVLALEKEMFWIGETIFSLNDVALGPMIGRFGE